MNTMAIRNAATKLTRGLAYFSLILQWSWLGLIALPPLISSGTFDALTMPTAPDTPIARTTPLEASPLIWAIVGSVTLVILALTVVVLIRLPRVVLETGERVVHQAAALAIPAVTHHKALPSKKRRVLSRRLTLLIQLIASILPAISSLLLPPYQELTSLIIVTIALWLAAFSVACFVIAWLVEPPVATSRTRSRASRG